MAGSRKVAVPSRYHTVADVVEDKLCHSCGVCGGICPQGTIGFDDHARPAIGSECNGCGLCLQVCSGWQGRGVRQGTEFSAVAFLAASAEEDLRLKSSSGGLVTELLRFLLRSGHISTALVTVADGSNPARPVSILADSDEQLVASAQSRYALFPWGKTVKDLMALGKPYAVVGTSCQLSSFHNVLRLFPKLRDNLVVTIGICCESNIEPQATDHMLQARGVAPESIEKIEYRSGAWPGVMSAFSPEGREIILSSRDRREGAINYLKLCYGRERCRYCGDILCEVADIAVGDPWGRDDEGRLVFRGTEGYSAALVREKAVAKWLHEMGKNDLLHLEKREAEDILKIQLRQAAAGRTKAGRAAVTAARRGRAYPEDLPVGGDGRAGLSITDICSMLLEAAARREPFRSIFMRIFFSRLGDYLTMINSRLKRLKSRKK